MSIGSQLRAARERRQMTMSDVAGATRSKVPTIEAIERDDFSVFPALIYGKGFIRLYAKAVGLDAEPLLEAYAAQTSPAKTPTLVSPETFASVPAPVTADPGEAAAAGEIPHRKTAKEYDLFNETEPRVRSAVEAPPPGAATRAAVMRELLREVMIRWGLALRESLRLGRTSAADIPVQKDPWTAVPVVIGIVIILIFVISGLSRCARSSDATGKGATGAGGQLRLASDVPEPFFE
ncbi:MAG: helix-turn-helix transcriptional regulator [Verrucomicrobia bacterium]|nr:helix-turn-helix transcriptional regulator [Verrucomicrobiota bacterium]